MRPPRAPTRSSTAAARSLSVADRLPWRCALYRAVRRRIAARAAAAARRLRRGKEHPERLRERRGEHQRRGPQVR